MVDQETSTRESKGERRAGPEADGEGGEGAGQSRAQQGEHAPSMTAGPGLALMASDWAAAAALAAAALSRQCTL